MTFLVRDSKGETTVDPVAVSPKAVELSDILDGLQFVTEGLVKLNDAGLALLVLSSDVESDGEGLVCEKTIGQAGCVTGQVGCAVQYSISVELLQKMVEVNINVLSRHLLDECGITYQREWVQ